MKPIYQAILSTLSYHSRFSYPLTFDELHRFLVINRPLSSNEVKLELDNLVKKRKIIKTAKFYHLSNLSNLRLRRAAASRPKLAIARAAARLIGLLPAVKLVCLTGALAMANSDPDDDIDLMIVTSKNRLWLTRPIIVLLVSIFFKRRRPTIQLLASSIQHRDEICLNLWLDETALEMSKHRQTTIIAHELAQMKPLVNKNMTYEKMLSVNPWVKNHLANFWQSFQRHSERGRSPSRGIQRSDLDRSLRSLDPSASERNISPLAKVYVPSLGMTTAFNSLNLLLFLLQLRYMSRRRTSEEVTLHSAFFHPRNGKWA